MDLKQKFERLSLLIAFILAFGGWRVSGQKTGEKPASGHQWTLVWSDEFSGANGSAPDPAKWGYDVGGGGWGNKELESYTKRPQNVYIENGMLMIRALHEKFAGPDGIARDYTSARLKTLNLFSQAYGRFEARVKIPYGQGLWPAFWLLGANIGQVGWPACGEIDIMENIGREPSTIHGTVHGPGYSGAKGISAAYVLPGGRRFSDGFHIFAVEWRPKRIDFFVDQHRYQTVTPAMLPAGARWVYDRPFFIILNVAVGGSWPGAPNSATRFPQSMQVDYVRVYK